MIKKYTFFIGFAKNGVSDLSASTTGDWYFRQKEVIGFQQNNL
jgi:hypothetical protein